MNLKIFAFYYLSIYLMVPRYDKRQNSAALMQYKENTSRQTKYTKRIYYIYLNRIGAVNAPN